MPKETQKEKIERLERELAHVTQQRNEVFQELSAMRKQVNAAVEDTDAYQILVKQLKEEQLKVKVAQHSNELSDNANARLRNANAQLKENYDALVVTHNALKNNFEALREQLRVREAETPKNVRGAGRKAALSDEARARAVRMHTLGLSYREIGKELGVSFSVIARACQDASQQK